MCFTSKIGVGSLRMDYVRAQRIGKKIVSGDEALLLACFALAKGDCVAVETLHGFQVLVDARNIPAIKRLKRRKNHPAHKPLAVMVRDEEAAKSLGVFSEAAWQYAEKNPCAITVVDMHPVYDLPEEISANIGDIALTLPYLPWQEAIFSELETDALAVTSANVYGESQIFTYEDMEKKLGVLADVILFYDGVLPGKTSESNTVVFDSGGELIADISADYVVDVARHHACGGHDSGDKLSRSVLISHLDTERDVDKTGLVDTSVLQVKCDDTDADSTIETVWALPAYVIPDVDQTVPWTIVLGLARSWRWPASFLDAVFAGGLEEIPGESLMECASMLDKGRSRSCTSATYLFDAASAIAGICTHASYEGRAWEELEWVATSWLESNNVDVVDYASIYFETLSMTQHWGNLLGFSRPFFDLIHGLQSSQRSLGEASARFHAHMAALFATALIRSMEKTGVEECVLSGALSHNRIVRTCVRSIVQRQGYRVRTAFIPTHEH